MFRPLSQPRIGEYLAPGLPMSFAGQYPAAVPAPALGEDTAAVLTEWLDMSEDEIRQLTQSATVATGPNGSRP
jgi:2-methylfumaryl-CoA isomerase